MIPNFSGHPASLCLGLTGRMAAGKGEAVVILGKIGFRYISLSDMVRREVQRLGREVTRHEMQDIGNRLRSEGGAGVLGLQVRQVIEGEVVQPWVVDGIRNPAEVAELRRLPNFRLLGITARPDILIQRLLSRGRATDSATVEELQQRLDREWGIGEPPDGQQVGACLQQADFVVENNSSLEQFERELREVLERFGGK